MYSLFDDLLEDVWEECYQMEKEKKNLGVFRVRIYVQGTSLKVCIHSLDPELLLLTAAGVVATLRKADMTPTVEMQP